MDMDKLGGVGNMDRTALPAAPEDMALIEQEGDASGINVGSSAGTGSGPYVGSPDEAEAETDEQVSGQLSVGGLGGAGGVGSAGNPAEDVQSSAQQSELVDNGGGLSGTENTTGADEPDLAG